MRDWQAFVRARLRLPALTPEREARIVRELAAQIEDFYRDARAGGATDEQADAHARAQITDWSRMADDLGRADRAHLRPGLDRLADRIESPTGGALTGGRLMFAQAIRDARFAVRQLARTPGFTLIAVLTLALGIGATSAIFSVVNGVLLRPLPYPESDRLVRVYEIVPQVRTLQRGARQLPGLARTELHLRTPGRVRERERDDRSGRGARAHRGRAGLVGSVRRPPRAPGARDGIRGVSGRAWRQRRHRHQPRPVGAAVRIRSGCRRPQRLAQRHAGHDSGRHAG